MADAVFWQMRTIFKLTPLRTSDCSGWLPPLVLCGSSRCHRHGFLLRASYGQVFTELGETNGRQRCTFTLKASPYPLNATEVSVRRC